MIASVLIGDYESRPEMRRSLRNFRSSNKEQFADVKDASQQGKGKGQTFTWDVVSNMATGGGTLVETNTMPETQFTVTQATLTINEYGNSVLIH